MKIVLFGAGSAQFGCGTLGDIFQSKIFIGSEVCIMDIDGPSLDKVYKTGLEFLNKHNLNYSLAATTDRKKALIDADFVIISIEIGDRFELWDLDWTLPQQYGIKQIYGENGGPGGLFHALRITPSILEICGDVMEYCPQAYVFCYSNPMTSITTTVLRKYPELKFVGLCHEVASLSRYLPSILNTSMDNLECRSAGLNHFSVLVSAKYKDSGQDAYGDILEKAPAFFAAEPGYSDVWEYTQRTGHIPDTEGALERHIMDKGNNDKFWSDRKLFKIIMEKFHLLPITVDSHLGEYISWAWDASDHKGILDFYTFYRYALSQDIRLEIDTKLHERVVPIMEGITLDTGYEEAAVNIMNKGFLPDLPNFVAVEVPAVISAKGVEGIKFNDYPRGFGALLRNYVGVYDLTAEAILTGSRDLVIQALLVNPVVDKCSRIDEMVDVMLDRQRKWLSYIK
jgi:alpha-galactosidase